MQNNGYTNSVIVFSQYIISMEQKFYNDGVTIISITTIILGCLVMSLKILFKSKCKDVNICFGLLKIKRTVELEDDIEIDNISNNKV